MLLKSEMFPIVKKQPSGERKVKVVGNINAKDGGAPFLYCVSERCVKKRHPHFLPNESSIRVKQCGEYAHKNNGSFGKIEAFLGNGGSKKVKYEDKDANRKSSMQIYPCDKKKGDKEIQHRILFKQNQSKHREK